jgi:hypothetical protein
MVFCGVQQRFPHACQSFHDDHETAAGENCSNNFPHLSQTVADMAVSTNIGAGRAHRSVRAVVVKQNALAGNSGGQGTDRPTLPMRQC